MFLFYRLYVLLLDFPEFPEQGDFDNLFAGSFGHFACVIAVIAEDDSVGRLVFFLAVGNAAKYCDDGGSVNVEFVQKGKNSVLTVSNSYAAGEGVDYSRFFKRFYREDKSHNSEKKGYGIGLPMASEMVKQFKGKMTVSYKDGTISFVVTL